jgi:hypothetical protein
MGFLRPTSECTRRDNMQSEAIAEQVVVANVEDTKTWRAYWRDHMGRT